LLIPYDKWNTGIVKNGLLTLYRCLFLCLLGYFLGKTAPLRELFFPNTIENDWLLFVDVSKTALEKESKTNK
jgi:hypothetical protein